MAAYLNRVYLIGNLTRDPEVRFTPSGTAVGDLRLAVNRRFRTNQGEDREETLFVSVTVFGRQAEPCGKYLRKGSQVLVEGRLRYEEWERDGQRQNKLSVVADRVQFMSPPRDHGGRESYADAPQERRGSVRDEGDAGGSPSRGDEPDHEDSLEDEDNIPF